MDYEEATRKVRHIIKYEAIIRAAIKEKRAEQTQKSDGGHVPGHVSKPTETAAIENLTPIKGVYYKVGSKKRLYYLPRPEQWIYCIEAVRETLTDREKAFLDVAFHSQDWSVCADFSLSRPTFYSLKNEMVNRVALKAAAEGLIHY